MVKKFDVKKAGGLLALASGTAGVMADDLEIIVEEPKPAEQKKEPAQEIRVTDDLVKKENKTRRVQLILKQSTYNKAKEEAEKRGISVNYLISQLIERL